jgi:hypothetical protein
MSVNQFSKVPPWKNQEHHKKNQPSQSGVDWLGYCDLVTRAVWCGLQAATAARLSIAIVKSLRREQDVPVPVGEPEARIWQKEERVHVSLPPEAAGVYVIQCYPGDAPATIRVYGVPLGVPETPQAQTI